MKARALVPHALRCGPIPESQHDWPAIFRRHWCDIVQQADIILRDQDAAEDVAQEAFLRLWHSAATGRVDVTPENAGRLLNAIAGAKARTRAAERACRHRIEGQWSPPESTSPKRQEEQEVMRQRVLLALPSSGMRQKTRRFVLAVLDGAGTCTEAALSAGYRLGTVKTRPGKPLRNAASALRVVLAE